MPIDTSSYYPEIDPPNGENKEDSLNGVHDSLFGDKKKITETLIIEEMGDVDLSNEPPHKEDSRLENIATTVSHILSWLLVPLIMPVFGILFILRLSILDVIPAGVQTAVTFVIAGINFFAPILLIFLLKVLGLIDDVGLNGRKERAIPYIITALCYGGSAWFVASRGAPVWVAMFFAGGAVASLINLAINFKWKISAHAAAIAGLVALLIRLQRDVAVEPQLFVWLIITVGMSGLLGSARIWLNRHTVWQVLAGYMVGFCSVFFMMYIH
ncbi:MAG: phosphatase PAP2 family protein [Muribaculaceae bacterium]|nr:phosphatase PAP2 family protein [Muribaculaceae bacterium]